MIEAETIAVHKVNSLCSFDTHTHVKSLPLPSRAFYRRSMPNTLHLMKNGIKSFKDCCNELILGLNIEDNLKVILNKLSSSLSPENFESLMVSFPFILVLQLCMNPHSEHEILLYQLLARSECGFIQHF